MEGNLEMLTIRDLDGKKYPETYYMIHDILEDIDKINQSLGWVPSLKEVTKYVYGFFITIVKVLMLLKNSNNTYVG